ncbi:MAG: PIN domain-containing protein, partial [Bacteroidia bacterium]
MKFLTPRMSKTTHSAKTKKIFVLDTSVIIYDHTALKQFAEHDVVIPITVLEELDQFKKGNDTKNFAAREFSRYIDKLSGNHSLQDWTPINGKGHGVFKIEMKQTASVDAEKVFGERKGDHKILNCALHIAEEHPDRQVVLVTKDINLRLKAKSLNLTAEDYETGKIKHVDELYTGRTLVEKAPVHAIDTIYEKGSVDVSATHKKNKPLANHFFILKN